MTLKDEIKLISEILVEKGLAESDEALLEEKIKLLERIIADPAKYREYDNLPTYLRYQGLRDVAKEINATDVQTIEEWKIPIERKIEECQEELKDVAPSRLEEALKKQKRELFIGIIGKKDAEGIQKGCRSLDNEVEDLRKAALEINPAAVDVIDGWDLTEDQRDYIFVQQKLREILNEKNPDITKTDIEKLLEIRARVTNIETGKNELTNEMRNLLNSSTIRIIFNSYERSADKTKEEIDKPADTQEL